MQIVTVSADTPKELRDGHGAHPWIECSSEGGTLGIVRVQLSALELQLALWYHVSSAGRHLTG